jgi:hypothetical protein
MHVLRSKRKLWVESGFIPSDCAVCNSRHGPWRLVVFVPTGIQVRRHGISAWNCLSSRKRRVCATCVTRRHHGSSEAIRSNSCSHPKHLFTARHSNHARSGKDYSCQRLVAPNDPAMRLSFSWGEIPVVPFAYQKARMRWSASVDAVSTKVIAVFVAFVSEWVCMNHAVVATMG